MYAIIRTGGKQYRVSEGDSIKVEKLEGEVGDAVDFEEVLMVGGDDGAQVGSPTLEGKVTGTIAEHGKGKKVLVFKFKRRKMYRRKRGHRQPFTRVNIDKIQVG
ncbi:MAG TPA: 50S ribosomal protein L21 [Acidobacteriota bacterium]|nr:50S ribosomal protein L21 [Acidobacteriota bacterium]